MQRRRREGVMEGKNKTKTNEENKIEGKEGLTGRTLVTKRALRT